VSVFLCILSFSFLAVKLKCESHIALLPTGRPNTVLLTGLYIGRQVWGSDAAIGPVGIFVIIKLSSLTGADCYLYI